LRTKNRVLNLLTPFLLKNMSETYSRIKGNISKKSERHTSNYLTQMALFAAIGDRFVAKILKQVANDYNLDFEEMKTRYCGKSSFELMVPTKQVEVDLEAPAVPEPESDTEIVPAPKPKKKASKPKEPKEPKEDTSKKLMALSKMKKPDLVAECEERGLDSEGTVAQLKERVKEARESEAPTAPKAAKKPAAKKEKATKEKKAPSKKKVAPPPPPPPEPLEEEEPDAETEGEEEEEPDSPGGIRAKMLREAKEFEEEEEVEEEEEDEDLQTRLRKILAEAEEEEFEDEMEETQVV